MRTFAVYRHPQMGYEAVKQGFSWPGFFFTWIWAFVKKLPATGVVLLIVLLGLRLIQETRELALTWLGLLGSIVVLLIVGFKGNEWRENKLAGRGYELAETLQAESPDAAVARVAREHTPISTSPVESGHFCEHCGKPISGAGGFCQFCGKATALPHKPTQGSDESIVASPQPPEREHLLADLKQYDTVIRALLRGLESGHARIVLNSHLQQLADLDLGHMLIGANIFEIKDQQYLAQLRPVLESIHSAASAAGKYLEGGARIPTSLQDAANLAAEASRKSGDYPPALYASIPNILMVTQSCLDHIAKSSSMSVAST